MNSIRIFGNAPVSILKEWRIVPNELNAPDELSIPFVTEVFSTRTAGSSQEVAEFFKFDPRTPETYEINLHGLETDSYEYKIELAEIIERAGEPVDIEIFAALAKLPDVRGIIDAS